MALDAEDLLIQPFRVVIGLGTTAVSNAAGYASHGPHGDADAMFRAAQALVRESERALKNVLLVWNTHVDKHGDAFRELMVQHASIEQRRLHLENLLWDFDDFIQPNEFDQARFSALQAATKGLAFDIVDTAKRLKWETVAPLPMPQGGFPPLPPLPSRPPTRSGHHSRPPSSRSVRPRALSRPRAVQGEVDHRHDAPPEGVQEKGKAVPRPHSKDQTRVPTNPGSPLTPPSSPRSGPSLAHSHHLTLDTSVRASQLFSLSSSPKSLSTRASAMSHTSSVTSSSGLLASLDSLAITDELPEPEPQTPAETATPLSPSLAASDLEPTLIGFEDMLNESNPTSEHRKSKPGYPPRIPDCAIRQGSTYYRIKGFCGGAARFRKDGHWGSIKLTTEYEYGGSGSGSGSGDLMRASDAMLLPLQYEATKVGACGECGYAHGLDEVEADKSNNPNAILTSDSGARYRLRLLFKSHIRQGSSTEAYYACLWCVQAGTTVREGDATVFTSPDDLLRHLACHPQPLPPIHGVEVRYGSSSDPTTQQPFDLHLPESPIPVPMPENVSRLPTATAIKDHCRRPGRAKLDKPPKYQAEMLQFLEGARIVGVMFPEKWGGKWCLGRHDGVFGAFPAKAIEVRAPQESEIPSGGESGMSITTKWKFSPPSSSNSSSSSSSSSNGVGGSGASPWLAFGKGEVLSNVQCLYADYWCWSGTNSKGKTGVFPQSHIDLQSLKRQEMNVNKRPSRGMSLFGHRAPKEKSGNRSSIML